MGPLVDRAVTRLCLRPYQTSTTLENLKRDGQGVFHVTDDVEMLARAAVGALQPPPRLKPAAAVHGQILADSCRWYAFRVDELDDQAPRARVGVPDRRPRKTARFFRLQPSEARRAWKRRSWPHVCICSLATRSCNSFDQWAVLVEKTAGDQERRAFEFLREYVQNEGDTNCPRRRGSRWIRSQTLQITAASRLHFGLLSFGNPDLRQYGGVGVMVDRPRAATRGRTGRSISH